MTDDDGTYALLIESDRNLWLQSLPEKLRSKGDGWLEYLQPITEGCKNDGEGRFADWQPGD